MNGARWVVVVMIVFLAVVTGMVYMARRTQLESRCGEAASRLAEEAESVEGYARSIVKNKLDLYCDDELQVYLGGKVYNSGVRKLENVYVKFEYLDKSGNPKRSGVRKFRLGKFMPGQGKGFQFPLYTLDREKAKPQRNNPDVLTWKKPSCLVSVYKVKFAD